MKLMDYQFCFSFQSQTKYFKIKGYIYLISSLGLLISALQIGQLGYDPDGSSYFVALLRERDPAPNHQR